MEESGRPGTFAPRLARHASRDTIARAADAGERALALLFLLLALPLLVLLALFVLASDGWPAFYRGERLGRGQRPFTLYKLRTLKRGAEPLVGGALLAQRHELILRGGTFLRDTRLDELPQLWNVVRGDMALLGPRPERAQVVRQQCASIPAYARRFAVRPGLIGVSQLFTPHGTDKRYRTLLDNGALRRGRGLGSDLGIIALCVRAVSVRVVQRLARKLGSAGRGLVHGRIHERRRPRRSRPPGALGLFATSCGPLVVRVLDQSADTLRVELPRDVGALRIDDFRLALPIERGAERPVWRSARCLGQVLAQRSTERGAELVLRYQPATPCSAYMTEQYFLRTSLAARHAPARRGERAVVPSLTLAALRNELARVELRPARKPSSSPAAGVPCAPSAVPALNEAR